jgi:hypothetical protein
MFKRTWNESRRTREFCSLSELCRQCAFLEVPNRFTYCPFNTLFSPQKLADTVSGAAGTKLFITNVKKTTEELKQCNESEAIIMNNIRKLEEAMKKRKQDFELSERIDSTK